MKQVLLDWFYRNGTGPEVCDGPCQYFVKCFTVYYTEEAGEFNISMKKDKDKKPIFTDEDWMKQWQRHGQEVVHGHGEEYAEASQRNLRQINREIKKSPRIWGQFKRRK